jgi:hypothetical protein
MRAAGDPEDDELDGGCILNQPGAEAAPALPSEMESPGGRTHP